MDSTNVTIPGIMNCKAGATLVMDKIDRKFRDFSTADRAAMGATDSIRDSARRGMEILSDADDAIAIADKIGKRYVVSYLLDMKQEVYTAVTDGHVSTTSMMACGYRRLQSAKNALLAEE